MKKGWIKEEWATAKAEIVFNPPGKGTFNDISLNVPCCYVLALKLQPDLRQILRRWRQCKI